MGGKGSGGCDNNFATHYFDHSHSFTRILHPFPCLWSLWAEWTVDASGDSEGLRYLRSCDAAAGAGGPARKRQQDKDKWLEGDYPDTSTAHTLCSPPSTSHKTAAIHSLGSTCMLSHHSFCQTYHLSPRTTTVDLPHYKDSDDTNVHRGRQQIKSHRSLRLNYITVLWIILTHKKKVKYSLFGWYKWLVAESYWSSSRVLLSRKAGQR